MKMKNKRADQIASRLAHKEKTKAKPLLERAKPERIEKPTILIVCEGENTEPSYFRQFRLPSATIKGVGYNTTSLVEKAKTLSEDKKYDQVWCVFDADPRPENSNQERNFNDAIKLAEKYKFNVAYSNQSFEYWLIIHFIDHQGGGMDRKDYHRKINQLLQPFNISYDGEGTKIITKDFFEILDGIDQKAKKERKLLAISRAERNYNQFDHTNPAKEESSTTVFKLVRELLKHI
jgi:hypothetical protein